ADGTHLFAIHKADSRLIVFDLTQTIPARVQEIMVGLEPITVRQRTGNELWVVNHLSDSISILDWVTGQITATLLVGDEPSDVVFAGNPQRAFVCVSQENLVRIYDPTDLTAPPVEVPLTQNDPWALAVSPDGQSVFVSALNSGNDTTVISAFDVDDAGGPPPPNPPMDPDLPQPPRVGLIVQDESGVWRDEVGGDWSAYAGYHLYDHDVIRLDAATGSILQSYSGVGTTLFGLAVHPVDGRLYVTNQEALNRTRFEPNLRARFVQNRISVIDPGTGTVVATHLNPHIDYDNPAGTPGERALSLSIPTAVAIASDGSAVYVAAFGSSKVAVLDQFGTVQHRIPVGDGPCGLALDEARDRLYVLRRIPGRIDMVDLTDDSVTSLGMGYDPTPPVIHTGRRVFYDGVNSSAHGDLSCASCHVFGDMDHLAWDLGDPQGQFVEGQSQAHAGFHPMKGPMMTQPLKGLADTAPFHWRGDRPALSDFNPAFVSLMGRDQELSPTEFSDLESFLFSLVYMPNPNRNLDGSLPNPPAGPNATNGHQLFLTGKLVDGGGDCVECHENPSGAKPLIIPFVLLPGDQDFTVPQLRNEYDKVGFDDTAPWTLRGVGYTHDGTEDDLDTFFDSRDFTFHDQQERDDVEAFLLAFDSGTHSGVGAQWTMDGTNEAAGIVRVQTLAAVADLGEIGLVAKGRDTSGDVRGWAYMGGAWQSDRASEPAWTLQDLLNLAGDGRDVTFTGVYAGWENRLGIDRDQDGYLDRDELDAGSDPGNPFSVPNPADAPEPTLTAGSMRLEPLWPNPAVRAARAAFDLPENAPVSVTAYDIAGRQVRSLENGATMPGGRHELSWDLTDDTGREVASGLYFVVVRSGDETRTRRLVVRR
ncbi:MAG: T9SS type A sorting domain-containing protein, partial [Candidatus Eisenbacteria bacterium]|nr:T9SS type A sorting domain-containing protein [Candidatus Eisenbacteria bacterium]